MRGTRKESAAKSLRTAHLLGIVGYMDMAMMAMWTHNPRAESIMAMAEASLRGEGPGGSDEALLKQMRSLVGEAREHFAAEDFPAAMARMRVAYDLAGLRIIDLGGSGFA